MINQYMGVARHLFFRVSIYIYTYMFGCAAQLCHPIPCWPHIRGFAIFSEAAVMDWESGFAQEVGTFSPPFGSG